MDAGNRSRWFRWRNIWCTNRSEYFIYRHQITDCIHHIFHSFVDIRYSVSQLWPACRELCGRDFLMRMVAKNNLTSSSSFCAFRKIARPNCGNGRNRWLPSLHAICELFQLHCEGKSGFSSSKIVTTLRTHAGGQTDATTPTRSPMVLTRAINWACENETMKGEKLQKHLSWRAASHCGSRLSLCGCCQFSFFSFLFFSCFV